MSEYIDNYLEENMVKQDDESMATYIYRTVNKNYNEMNPPSFQRFLDQMLLLCKDIDKNKFQKE
tara:strand:+ start:137 stop:328 length:192 start_codon:yes stop_codon:yes gene_type:complete